MKSTGVWFFFSCKRYLRKVSFLLILLVLPAVTFLVRRLEKEEGQEVRIAVCAEAAEEHRTGAEIPLEMELAESLMKGENAGEGGLFHFYICQDEEQVKNQVASGQAECGYVISGDLRRRLDEQDYKRCIRVYSAPSTVLADLSTEVVFAALMKLYGREIFLDYVMKAGIVQEVLQDAGVWTGNDGGIEAAAGELYDKWLNNGSTFRFDYHYRKQAGKGESEETKTVRVFPVRGIVAVYLLLAGLYSAVMLGCDERKGMFVPLSPVRRFICRLAVLGAPVFLAALSAFGALKTGGCLEEPVREMTVMGLYVLAVCIFSYILKTVCKTPWALCSLIPMFLVGSLIFAPVFVDIRQFFPEWGWIEKLFLPSYYLRVF